MNSFNLFHQFLTMFLFQLPTLLVCVVACVLILTRWREAPRASLWALLGFGSVMGLSVLVPLAEVLVRSWVIHNHPQDYGVWVYGIVGVVGSVLHAATYVFLLIAILAGRAPVAAPNRQD